MAGLQATRPFRPQATGSTSLAVTAASGSVAIPGAAPTEVRLSIPATDSAAFIEFGTSTITAATATGMRIAPGAVEVFRVPLNATHIAAITASGTATLYITSGEGT